LSADALAQPSPNKGFVLVGDNWFPRFRGINVTGSVVVDEAVANKRIGEVTLITVEIGVETVSPLHLTLASLSSKLDL
jgi:hypothetical protein